MSVRGKTAIITGGAQGLGLATGQRLLDQGANVVIADVDRGALDDCRIRLGAQAAGVEGRGAWHAVLADASTEAGADAYIGAAVERFGGVQLFVNNAAILGPWQRIEDTPLESFDRLYAVNVRSVFIGLRAAIRQMAAQGGGGAIVNVASLAAERATAGRALYGSAKRAVIGLAKSAALEAARHGIRVNCVAPGLIDTRMGREGAGAQQQHGARMPLDARPIPRKADPAEIAALIAWLLSEEASFVTGAVYAIDGGAAT